MRHPTHSELLTIWDEAGSRHPVHRALTLLTALYPDTERERLERLSIGQRDGLLLELRELLFGPVMTSQVDCPACSDRLELTIDVAEIRASGTFAPAEEHSLATDGYVVRFRLPDSRDLLAAAAAPDCSGAEAMLLERCLLSVQRNDTDFPTTKLPREVVESISDAMERVDPLGNIELMPRCRTCAHEWRLALDITTYMWDEITHWAIKTLRNVHALAVSYGWSEAEILAMSPRRRQIYLELAAV